MRTAAVTAVGLDSELFDLESREFLACALRRAAGMLSPVPPRTLIRVVLESIANLTDVEDFGDRVEEVLDDLMACGDLVESEAPDEDSQARLVFLGAPRFVERASGLIILLGVAPDDAHILPEDMTTQVSYRSHLRFLPPSRPELGEDMLELGLARISEHEWIRTPASSTAASYLQVIDEEMNRADRSGEVPGLTILDSSADVIYYKGRWKVPTNQQGRFVARRQQAYGADIWCYVELEAGLPVRLIDLPFQEPSFRGCDAAWRLQAAIDAGRQMPQEFRASKDETASRIDLFSPPPMWLSRRWSSLGRLLPRSRSALFSFEFDPNEGSQEELFLEKMLWMKHTE